METLKNKEKKAICHAGSSIEMQNIAGTDSKIDRNLTQPDSRSVPMTDFTETSSMLKKMAMAHGADSAIGHACHNLLEMTENYAKFPEIRPQLAVNIEREKKRLDELKRGLTA